jgi:hypothetical protein
MIQTIGDFRLPAAADLSGLDPALPTLAALVLGLLAALALCRRLLGRRPARRPGRTTPAAAVAAALPDTVAFEPVAILNRDEGLLLPLLEAAARTVGRGHRVLARASLADLLRPAATAGSLDDRRAAAAALATRRLDYAIIDGSGRLVAAVAYHGTAHYLDDAFKDDAIKREVIRRAGVLHVEIAQGFDDAEVLDRICALLAPGRGLDAGEASARVIRLRHGPTR